MRYLLFLLACTAGEPQQCTEQTFPLPEVTNATGCHLAGHFRLSQWISENPDMTIEEANCMTRPLAMLEIDPHTVR